MSEILDNAIATDDLSSGVGKFKLASSATYYEDGDIVLGEAWIHQLEEYKPNQALGGTTELLMKDEVIGITEFDKRFGCTDGSFKFTFLHPAAVQNLSFRVQVTVEETGEVLKSTVPVPVEKSNPNFEAQPDDHVTMDKPPVPVPDVESDTDGFEAGVLIGHGLADILKPTDPESLTPGPFQPADTIARQPLSVADGAGEQRGINRS